MNALYNFAVGPLAWIAFTVCIGGMIWRLWSLGRLARQRDASALAYMNWKDSLTSIIRWTLPFSTCGWRENPLLTVANFVLHIGILLAVLFYSAHNVMWDYNFGFSLPSLPDGFMDTVTLATILACLVLGWRRLAVPASSYVTRQADWFSLLLVTGVMVTGFASAHGFGSESSAPRAVRRGDPHLPALHAPEPRHSDSLHPRLHGFRIHRRPSYLRLVILEAHDGN